MKITEKHLRKIIKESISRVLNESRYLTVGPILQNGESEEEAREFLRGYTFNEDEPQEENIRYAKLIDSYNGVDLLYDYGADYYFFAITDEARNSFQNRLQKGEYWIK